MFRYNTGMLLRLILAFVLLVPVLRAEVVRIELQSRADLMGGKSFGLAGPYEKLVGKVHFAVDPANPRNQIITDITRAPRNGAGLVEFSADLFVLQPKEAGRGNRTALYEVSNRGGKSMLAFFNRTLASLDPSREVDFGDGYLLRQGYTLVWLGWQWDVPERPGLMRLYTPRVPGVQGLVRCDFVPAAGITRQKLSDRDHIPYPVANPADPAAVLTVRDKVDSPRGVVPHSHWRFSDDRQYIEMPSGFEPRRIYEVVYTASDPVVTGLGPAAVRDFLSFLKHGATIRQSAPGASPLHSVQTALGFGISQSGRFLRTFLYYGFNEDESGRQVFDGVIAHVAGGGRGSFNHRFAQPSRDAHPFMNFFYPTDIFPFTDNEQTDPETGSTDGLLVRARKTNTVPHIFYTNSSYEYWGRAASLIHTTLAGDSDAAVPGNVRIYTFAGGQHGPSRFPPERTDGLQLNNPNAYTWCMRALLAAMHRWVTDGVEPPASAYARVADGTLAAPKLVRFPKLPGMNFPIRPHLAYRVDYGPEWRAGLVTIEPPRVGKAFPILVPQVDDDGNEVAGIRTPEVAVPLATYTGWNLFRPESGPPDELSSMLGSFIPLARTRAERLASGDPRLSVEERYASSDAYIGKFAEAAAGLVERGLLLPEDVPPMLKIARTRWDFVTATKRSTQSRRDRREKLNVQGVPSSSVSSASLR